MAYNETELGIIKLGLENGKSKDEVKRALVNFRLGRTPSAEPTEIEETGGSLLGEGRFQDTVGDIKGIGTDIKQSAFDRADKFGEQKTLLGKFGQGVGFATDVVGNVFKGFGKALVTDKGEEQIGGAIQSGAEKIASLDTVKSGLQAIEGFKERNPELGEALDAVTNTTLLGLDLVSGGAASQVTKRVGQKVVGEVAEQTARTLGASRQLVDDARNAVGSLFEGRAANSIDEVIDIVDSSPAKLSDTSPAGLRATAEGTAPTITIKEKFAGISPDIKKRLQIAGTDKVQEYFDIAHARNLDDTMPTPYEFAGNNVKEAANEVQKLLSDSGSEIGRVRTKYSTLRPRQDQLFKIESAFENELTKLNLQIVDGQVVQKAGKLSRVESPNDIKLLNNILDEYKKVKQNPSLENIIDFRGVIDGQINFGKSTREVSNSVDPLSRVVRAEVKDVAGEIVGKSNAAELTRYSETIDALNQLKSYTNRNAGAEYLMKVVLSGRGGDARKVLENIKDLTGIDLMNDATLMTLATDLIGNSRQKNLFRQEITKAGLDASAILRGDPRGAANLLFNYVKDNFLADEKIFIDAAKN